MVQQCTHAANFRPRLSGVKESYKEMHWGLRNNIAETTRCRQVQAIETTNKMGYSHSLRVTTKRPARNVRFQE